MHIKPKKRLGQNFLIDKNIQKKIIESCEFSQSDIVLEIGAGRGEMTSLIAEKVAFVYALEIDVDLCKILKHNLANLKNVEIINQNILKFDFKNYFRKIKKRIKVAGNIPYYITTPIIERLLEYKDKIEVIFIAVQKEFASRLISGPDRKEYGSLSCFLQYYTKPQIMFFISKNCFRPVPKVDSCFLKLSIRRTPPVKIKDEKLFFNLIRTSFNQRRKTLRNSLKDIIPKQQKLEMFFEKYAIDRNIRPENLALSDFAHLSECVSPSY